MADLRRERRRGRDLSGTLVCPRCDALHDANERFCLECGMPLVVPGLAESAVSERQARARKIKKQFTDGPLVRVATARHQAEAELISGLLLEHGVPSLVRRTGGFDVPDMMFSGPREILVPESGAQTAREALGEPDAEPVPIRTVSVSNRVFALLAAAILVAGGITPVAWWIYHGFS